jgi:long-chain acyl-CoA synthetase
MAGKFAPERQIRSSRRSVRSASVNLAGPLLRAAAATPDRIAIAGPDQMTYGELARRVDALAARISESASPGDRVAIVAGNEPEFVVAYLAVLMAGGVAVPLNPASPSQEVARELEAVQPALVLTSSSHNDLARRAGAHLAAAPPTLGVDDTDPGTGAEPLAQPVERSPDDLAALLFTAGTAGAPKAAMLTHGSLLANLEQVQQHPGLRIRDTDVALGVLPFFHVFGLNVVLGLTLFAGASIALVENFHPAETLARVQRDGVTVVAAVPAVYAAWLALDETTAPADAFARVRLCVSGATALSSSIVTAMRERFGVHVHDGYGLTEASPVVTTTAVAPEPRIGSIGPPLPGIDVRLVDADGHDVLNGDPGEILVRGPNVFAGYWQDEGATRRVLDDGWLHTGDIAVAGDDGWLALVDRAKDVIIVSGFNVFPGEVEDALLSHPDVADAAVVGDPHPRTGETVVAYVVATAGATLDPVELIRHAGRRLARYKLPTRVEVVDEVPRAFAGKLLRRALSGDASSTATTATGSGREADATTKPA